MTLSSNYFRGVPERTESFEIKLKFDASNLTSTERAKVIKITKSGIDPKNFIPGDMLDFNYKFDILYFKGVVENFNSILMLFDKASVVEAKTSEIKHGKSLIQELLAKIEKLEKKYSEKIN